MKIIENALSEDLFSRCKVECNNKLRENVWGSSTITWPKGLKEGIDGSTMATETSLEIRAEIEKELAPHLPPFPDGLMTQYYIWQPNSGIGMHNDEGKRFGATIYLNDTWHPNSGGWFIWKDDPDKSTLNALLPQRNCMVLNDRKEWHLVTRVSGDGLAIRITIQIWGIKS